MTIRVEKPLTTFIHIPKTGGVSISHWLKDNVGGRDWPKRKKHITPKEVSKYTKTVPGFMFCVVRNPWERMASMFFYLQRKTPSRYPETFEEFLLNRDWGAGRRAQTEFSSKCDYVMRFETLEKDFFKIQERFQCYRPLPLKNDNPDKPNYFELYTPKMRDLVARRHASDIETFGYEFHE